MPNCIPVDHDDIDRWWPIARPYIVSAAGVPKNPHDIEEIEGDVLARLRQLWMVTDSNKQITGAIVTHTYETREGEICQIEFAGGNLEHGMRALDDIEAWATGNRMIAMRVDGRGGWAKKLKPYGYQEVTRILEKDLPNER